MLDLHGINVINVVRRDESVEDLKCNFSSKYVLNSSSPTFESDLDKLIEQLHPTVLYECVGGEVASKIIQRLPPRSLILMFGELS